MKGALYVENSKNSKISGDSRVDATYASIKRTCPDTCGLKDAGCYAKTSYTGIVVSRMDSRARQSTPLQVARAEAKAIDDAYKGGQVPAGRDLRLHVSGDSRTVKGTRVISAAISRWKQRGGGTAWSYTHAWRHVPRSVWDSVSVLGSIDKPEESAQARAQGYAPALVVGTHPTDKAYKVAGSDTTYIPCPQQTRGVPCVQCRLCMRADWLFNNNKGIAFAAHGVYKEVIKRRLNIIQ